MAEKDLIARYFAPLATLAGAADLRDDVALLSGQGPRIITTDALVEGVHFLSGDPVDTVARKLVRVNVSDVIAKGAKPKEALLTLGWPKHYREADMAIFAAALGDELAAWGASLIGGDTVSSLGGLFMSITLTGVCQTGGPVRRSGAKTGDDIWLSGEIGAGKRGYDAALAGTDEALASQYRLPNLPDVAIASMIAAHANASGDISDGLFGDALALANASDKALTIELSQIAFSGSPEAQEVQLALASWGDDYQCLFTAGMASRDCIEQDAAKNGLKLARIGAVHTGQGLKVTNKGQFVNLPETLAFEHG